MLLISRRKQALLLKFRRRFDEWATVEAGARLFTLLQGRALAVSGASIKGP